MKLEDDYKKDLGKGSGTETGYCVEAKHNYRDPIKLGEQIFDKEWRRINFSSGDGGVPQCNSYSRYIKEHGYFSYQAAEALRWWFHATAAASNRAVMFLESRIVKIKIEHNYSIEAISAHKPIGGEGRTNCIPDWGVDTNDTK